MGQLLNLRFEKYVNLLSSFVWQKQSDKTIKMFKYIT